MAGAGEPEHRRRPASCWAAAFCHRVGVLMPSNASPVTDARDRGGAAVEAVFFFFLCRDLMVFESVWGFGFLWVRAGWTMMKNATKTHHLSGLIGSCHAANSAILMSPLIRPSSLI